MWLRQVLVELGFPPSPTIIYEDNKSAINIGNDKGRTKHMDIHHYVRELIHHHHLSVLYRPTSTITADILTKPLDIKPFLTHHNS